MSIRVMLAGDHRLILEVLAETLALVLDFRVVDIACENEKILTTAVEAKPDIMVLGSGALGDPGLDLVQDLRARVPSCGIVLLAAEPSRPLVTRAVNAGVLGIVSKQAELSCLITTLRGVAAGNLVIPPGALGDSPPRVPRPLSDRETQILRLTATGASIKEIAREMYLAAGTVRNLSSAAIKKLEGRNRFDAARIAAERGWL
ncbi:response regulator transcription factor [Streptomyces sp. ST2-7A]|uniref:LuxR C-terminal-related transcriptional regulator n=1 Tax=Streptomyces sp. ST2-7A TaxID=2907214 RepID=UPI001F23EE45|nr:response regulator transcription factor [Streptomyces sp. ST2-7A]MCE7080551.1 response regulator transcription factor [Streptomyces sp. ST2-7A]